MNLASADIEYDLFTLLEDQETVDIPTVPEPTKRKSVIKGNTKKRRAPIRKQTISIDALLNSDGTEHESVFTLPDDVLPSHANQKAKSEPEKPVLVVEEKVNDAEAKPIDKLEVALTNYIANSIEKIRQEFIFELNKMIDNSEEEQSMINTFVLGLPSEMEEAVASEIALAKAVSSNQSDSDKLQATIDTQLDPLWRVVPKSTCKNGQNITIQSLTNRVITSRTEMSAAIEEAITDVRNERSALISAREQLVGLNENDLSSVSINSLRIEVEANSRRLDIEEQFLKSKRNKLEAMQKDWREAQMNSDLDESHHEQGLLAKLEAITTLIPNSKLRTAVNNLESLTETVRKSHEDVRNIRNQLEMEVEGLSYALKSTEAAHRESSRPMKVPKREQRRHENVIDEAREKIDELRRKRRSKK